MKGAAVPHLLLACAGTAALGPAGLYAQGPAPADSEGGLPTARPTVLAAGTTGFALVESRPGFEIAGGLAVRIGDVSLLLTPADLTLVEGDGDPRYAWDTLATGGRRCRDLETGRFAKSSECIDVDVLYAASAEARYLLGSPRHPVILGLGLRLGDGGSGYATAGYALGDPRRGPFTFLKAAAGRRLLKLSLGGAVPLL